MHPVCHRHRKETLRNPTSSNLSTFRPRKRAAALTAFQPFTLSTPAVFFVFFFVFWFVCFFFSPGKRKASCWNAFMEADNEITDRFSQLGATATISSDDRMALIEKLVSQLYLPKTEMSAVSEVRWWLFRKVQAQSERLPPTQATLRQAILKAHQQPLCCGKPHPAISRKLWLGTAWRQMGS